MTVQKKAVFLLSGGLDSATTAAMALAGPVIFAAGVPVEEHALPGMELPEGGSCWSSPRPMARSSRGARGPPLRCSTAWPPRAPDSTSRLKTGGWCVWKRRRAGSRVGSLQDPRRDRGATVNATAGRGAARLRTGAFNKEIHFTDQETPGGAPPAVFRKRPAPVTVSDPRIRPAVTKWEGSRLFSRKSSRTRIALCREKNSRPLAWCAYRAISAAS